MPQVNVTVSWDTQSSKPKPNLDPIMVPQANGATVIQWTADSTVASFQITGLDSGVFTAPQSSNGGKVSTSTDRNQNPATYSYTISGTQAGTGKVGSHDPRIENGGGPLR
jgi:hypothetical protein